MGSSIIILVLVCVLFIMLVISAVVSATETAITGVDFIKIETLADKNNLRAKKVLSYKDRQQKVISTMLFLNNVVNIVSTTITTILVTIYIKNIPLAVATAVLTFIILIFCEITPKRMANKNPEKIILMNIGFVEVVVKLFFPFVSLLSFVSDGVGKLLKIDLVETEEEPYSEEELKTIVDLSHEQGVLETEEKVIIENALEFGDIKLKDVMVPIAQVSYINVDATYDDVINKFNNNEYTRYPVVENSVDNVVGILNIKDFIKLQKIDKGQFNIKELMREPFCLNENVKISSAFRRMQKVYTNVVIVRGDNCKTLGIATLEDILEEIVGEINDEFDE